MEPFERRSFIKRLGTVAGVAAFTSFNLAAWANVRPSVNDLFKD